MRVYLQKFLTVLLALGTVSVVAYVASIAYEDWQDEAPYRAAMARKRYRTELWNRVDQAVSTLESRGVRFAYTKGLACRWIDLSAFNGSVTELGPIRELTVLKELKPVEGVTLHLRLGPAIDDSFIPLLATLDTLEVLEFSNSSLTDEAKQELMDMFPKLKIEQVVDIF